jgi:hypothetical protein
MGQAVRNMNEGLAVSIGFDAIERICRIPANYSRYIVT